jgi:8-hydroxy-5-deazaflavin:NADPH oxidoreductase
MKIGVLGTGGVGQIIGNALMAGGHDVRMGSRTPDSRKAKDWAASAGPRASYGTFADAASFGETIFNCTAGAASLAALQMAGPGNLAGKVLIDLSNPLDFSRGMPPTLSVCNDDSVGEQIQRAFPDARVVKTLNTVTAPVMVNPALVPGEHVLFLAGNDKAAKAQVSEWLVAWFGWTPGRLLDLGDISGARGMEMYLPLWIRLMQQSVGHPFFNVQVVKGAPPKR